ncbi:MAG: SufD family Fe-S cluster assembly protein, partial [Bradyrhizobium sp.]
MNLALAKTDSGHAANSIFLAAGERLPGSARVADARRQAFAAYERLGLPHRRIEEWKYTDLRTLMHEVLPLAGAPDAKVLERARKALRSLPIEGRAKLVLVDGVFAPELSDLASLSGGITVRTLRDVLESDGGDAGAGLLLTPSTDAMISLNAALATDGVVVDVANGAALADPIHIIHIAAASSAATFTRSHLKFGNGARASLMESFIAAEGAGGYQVNDAVIVSVGDDVELSHVRLMADGTDAVNIASAIVTVGAGAKLDLFNLTSGGAVNRFQGFITFRGEGSELSANGVNLLRDKQHGDTTLVVDHAVPQCVSRE